MHNSPALPSGVENGALCPHGYGWLLKKSTSLYRPGTAASMACMYARSVAWLKFTGGLGLPSQLQLAGPVYAVGATERRRRGSGRNAATMSRMHAATSAAASCVGRTPRPVLPVLPVLPALLPALLHAHSLHTLGSFSTITFIRDLPSGGRGKALVKVRYAPASAVY